MDKQLLIKTRSLYCDLVRQELLGPGSEISLPDAEHELITSLPHQRYSIGVLYPQGVTMGGSDGKDDRFNEESADDSINEFASTFDEDVSQEVDASDQVRSIGDAAATDEETLDEEVELATQQQPSSFGISFMVDGEVSSLKCRFKAATYWKADIDDYKYPFPHSYDVDSFVENGLEKVFLRAKDGDYFVFADGVDAEIIKEKISALKDKLNVLKKKSEESPDFQNSSSELKSELFWQKDLLEKGLSFLYKKGYIRNPENRLFNIDLTENYATAIDSLSGVNVKLTVLKRLMTGGKTAITVMLVNEETGNPTYKNCLCQPELLIGSDDNDNFHFSPLQAMTDFSALDDEEKVLDLQYRNKQTYASGLGVSADWRIDPEGKGFVRTEFMPCSEVPSMDFNVPSESGIDPRALSMRFLSDMDATSWETKKNCIATVVDAYGDWIERLSKKNLDPKYSETAEKMVKGCQEALGRMHMGLQMLDSDPQARAAFELANRAMYMQRFHIKLQEKTSSKDRFNEDEELAEALEELDYGQYAEAYKCEFGSDLLNKIGAEKNEWRLFQLAFLLLSVPGIVDPTLPDRDVVDLIWFPTGGGKTEAYLGLTAFTIFYRRLKHGAESGGTTVIMRYTLRLLAAQQFTRASTLICACELIRENNNNLGRDPITIGLWIGGDHTPNQTASAKSLLAKLTGEKKVTAFNLENQKEKHYKFQLLKCPWCGTKMVKEIQSVGEKKIIVGDWGASMLARPERFRFHCPQETCAYENELPVQVVDQELYANPPTLLFATVDKFAMMAWKSQIRSFFACNPGNRNRAPELIIQDELHLISGPLGTMVAMYETVIDELCSCKKVRPKIVASTATIRRAAAQCGALYAREVRQFPSPGIDADDSFFSREAQIDYTQGKHGRLYVGMMPSGKTKTTMQIRAIAALLQKITDMEIEDDRIRDQFWTLTTYFNSLRDLGKCSTLVCDDVKDSIRFMKGRLSTRFGARNYTLPDELTSRVKTTELNKTLDKLEKNTYTSDPARRRLKRPSDIVLATNMISVGIDVSRLNVMLMVGQPKLTSEYIQASSRVGRSGPGVVFVQYDAAKSRDRSHYEQFSAYHEGFYRYVEPTGATPFSRPSIDRAMHALLVSLLRLSDDNYGDSPTAIEPDDEVVKTSIRKILNRMKRVLEMTTPEAESSVGEAAIVEELEYADGVIDEFLHFWSDMSDAALEEKKSFNYGEQNLMIDPGTDTIRLLKAFGASSKDDARDTLTSMRNVDAAVPGCIILENKVGVQNVS